jgi:ElaB/YqjD/DUF883 family membrane-anchored ribosome-binding protein
MHEPSEVELRARIEETRGRMGETIEEIGERVNPDRVKAELRAHAREQVEGIKNNVKEKARSTMREVKHEVRDTGRGIWDTIRDNPIPAGMVGVGLAWLIANRSDSHEKEYGHYGYDYGYDRGERPQHMGPAVPFVRGMDRDYSTMDVRDRYTGGTYSAGSATGESHPVRDAVNTMQSKAQDGVDTVRDTVGDAVDTVRDAAGDAVDTVRDTAAGIVDRASHGLDMAQDAVGDWAGQARRRAVRVEQRVEYATRDNPLAAGAVAVAVGLVAGLMIPQTRREHRLMGDARDRVMEKAGEMAHEAADKVRDVAQEAGDVLRDAVDDAAPDDMKSGWSAPGGA